jgi:class 3 adenylate cyclase
MPLFMDRHDIKGVTAEAVVEAHEKDMAVQGKHGANYISYWVDEARGSVFCLCDAPSKEVCEQVHREAHGLVANHIMEVDPATVEAFLGNIAAPTPMQTSGRLDSATADLTVASTLGTSAFRAILFTDMQDSTARTRELGDAAAMDLLRTHNRIIRDRLKAHDGREVKHTGDGFMVCFASVSQAVECSIAILKNLAEHNQQNPSMPIHVRIGLTAGEPVEEDNDLFGATVQLAARLCAGAGTDSILVSGVVRDLCLGKKLPFSDASEKEFKGFDQPVRGRLNNFAGYGRDGKARFTLPHIGQNLRRQLVSFGTT